MPRYPSGEGETQPLLSGVEQTGLTERRHDIAHVEEQLSLDERAFHGHPDALSEKRHLGLMSTAFLIFNRVIGTSIFATPSVILRTSGSVGLSFVMWLLGALVAACGTAVYVELGTGLPRNGGEKNYLEYIYRRPRFLATCVYAAYATLIGWSSANCSVFGEYALHAIDPEHTPTTATARLAGVACITFALLLHGIRPQWGVRVQNTLGFLKIFALGGIAIAGLLSLWKVPGFAIEDPPKNFDWNHMWQGSGRGGISAFVTGLFTVVWSFVGYSNANYALSEVRDPVRTIRRAAPLAMICVTVAYLLANIAYYSVVSKDEMLGSGRIVAALFFGKLWGIRAERAVSALVAMSTLANVLTVLFTQGRVVQELGREGILPFSSFFASNKPFGLAPLPGLAEQWFLTSFIVLAVPPGDAYLFMLNMSTYPLSLINAFVSAGLLFLHLPASIRHRVIKPGHELDTWSPPFRARTLVVIFFFVSNVFLVFAPLVPPAPGFRVYEHLPYWLHVLVASSISLIGATYWYLSWVWIPRRSGYTLVTEITVEDGVPRKIVKKVGAGR